MLKAASYTTEGTRKKVNQDAYCVLMAQSAWGPIAFAVVCDGVGGLSAGELASSTVIARFARWFEQDFPFYLKHNSTGGIVNFSALEGIWTQLLSALNEKVFKHGKHEGLRLGTTFSGLLICQGKYFIGHVGDCRVYRCRNGAAEVLTNDQTLVARELVRGNITAEEAENHPKRNVLLQAVGSQDEVRPEFFSGEAQEGDQFIVCCDGFYRRLSSTQLYNALATAHSADEETLEHVCENLAQQVIDRGETDNVTVVCVSISAEEEHTTLLDEPSKQGGDL